jgi:hypothetical protein
MPQSGPFHGIVPGVAATHVGQITIPVTFGTRENFYTQNLQFDVADFETAYNAFFTKNLHFDVADFETAYNTFLGLPTLSKFMVIPHYAYLVLKMPGPHGVIPIKGDVKRAFDCDRESYETADRLTASAELQDLKQALAESPSDLVMPKAKTSKTSIQSEDSLSKTIPLSTEESSKVAHVGKSLDSK